MMTKEQVYMHNVQILYSDLRNAINVYIDHGYSSGEMKYINAYLMAVLGAIVAYKDTVLEGQTETTEMKACKYANNMLKHDPKIITHTKHDGGTHLPMKFPCVFPKIDVVWKWQKLDSKHADQKQAFKESFAEQPVLKTLEIVLDQLGIDIKL